MTAIKKCTETASIVNNVGIKTYAGGGNSIISSVKEKLFIKSAEWFSLLHEIISIYTYVLVDGHKPQTFYTSSY